MDNYMHVGDKYWSLLINTELGGPKTTQKHWRKHRNTIINQEIGQFKSRLR